MLVQPSAASGRLEDNPLRKDIEEGTALLGVDFILNAIVDQEHNIQHVTAGDVTAAHRQGCQVIAKRGKIRLSQRLDIVLASAGGFPKDINLYQAHKAMENAHNFLKENGTLILVAECREGIGNQIFEDWMRAGSSPQEILSRIQKEFILGGHKAAAIAAIEEKVQVSIISSLSNDLIEILFMTPFSDPQDALQAALEKHGKQSQILVLPEAVSIIADYQ